MSLFDCELEKRKRNSDGHGNRLKNLTIHVFGGSRLQINMTVGPHRNQKRSNHLNRFIRDENIKLNDLRTYRPNTPYAYNSKRPLCVKRVWCSFSREKLTGLILVEISKKKKNFIRLANDSKQLVKILKILWIGLFISMIYVNQGEYKGRIVFSDHLAPNRRLEK